MPAPAGGDRGWALRAAREVPTEIEEGQQFGGVRRQPTPVAARCSPANQGDARSVAPLSLDLPVIIG